MAPSGHRGGRLGKGNKQDQPGKSKGSDFGSGGKGKGQQAIGEACRQTGGQDESRGQACRAGEAGSRQDVRKTGGGSRAGRCWNGPGTEGGRSKNTGCKARRHNRKQIVRAGKCVRLKTGRRDCKQNQGDCSGQACRGAENFVDDRSRRQTGSRAEGCRQDRAEEQTCRCSENLRFREARPQNRSRVDAVGKAMAEQLSEGHAGGDRAIAGEFDRRVARERLQALRRPACLLVHGQGDHLCGA